MTWKDISHIPKYGPSGGLYRCFALSEKLVLQKKDLLNSNFPVAKELGVDKNNKQKYRKLKSVL